MPFWKDLKAELKTIFASKEIRGKILFTLFALLVLRLLAAVPVPGVDPARLDSVFSGAAAFDNLLILSGGLLQTASIVAVGISPYITSSIIIQLLTSVVPKLEELKKQGSEGQQKINTYTRIITIPLAIIQSMGFYFIIRNSGLIDEVDQLGLLAIISIWTAGAMFVMWLGERITESGLGNGASVIILFGILATLPNTIISNLETADWVGYASFITLIFLIFGITVFFNEAEKRVKLVYSRRVRSGSEQENYLPIKVLQFGVMPVIFATSLMSFPLIIADLIVNSSRSSFYIEGFSSFFGLFPESWFNGVGYIQVTEYAQTVSEFFSDGMNYQVGVFILVIAFSFFYVTLIFNPDDYAENLQKQGAFIPGVRPGKQTADYLRKASLRLTALGGLFLAVLSVLPAVLQATVLPATFINGTSLLIAVSVLMSMRRQVKSLVVVRDYDQYL